MTPSSSADPVVSQFGPELAALACAFLWAFNGLVLRTQSDKVTPAAMNTIRCGIAGVLMWLVLPFDPTRLAGLLEIPPSQWALLFLSFSVGIALGDTLYLGAIKEIGVSRSMALTGTFPLTTLVWEVALLGSSFDTTLALGSLLVALGVVCLARTEVGATETPIHLRRGIALALIASILWGFSSTLLKPATVNMSPVQANAVRMPMIALLVYLVRVLPQGNKCLRGIGWRSFLIVGATGILGMGAGSYLFIYAIANSSPTKVVTLTASSPLFGMAMAALFLRERITLWVAAGMALCVGGVYLVI